MFSDQKLSYFYIFLKHLSTICLNLKVLYFFYIVFDIKLFFQPSLSPNTVAKWEERGFDGNRDNTRSSSSDTIGSAHEATEVMPHASKRRFHCKNLISLLQKKISCLFMLNIATRHIVICY